MIKMVYVHFIICFIVTHSRVIVFAEDAKPQIDVDVMFSVNDTLVFKVVGYPHKWFFTAPDRASKVIGASLTDSLNRSPCVTSDGLCTAKVIGFSECVTSSNIAVCLCSSCGSPGNHLSSTVPPNDDHAPSGASTQPMHLTTESVESFSTTLTVLSTSGSTEVSPVTETYDKDHIIDCNLYHVDNNQPKPNDSHPNHSTVLHHHKSEPKLLRKTAKRRFNTPDFNTVEPMQSQQSNTEQDETTANHFFTNGSDHQTTDFTPPNEKWSRSTVEPESTTTASTTLQTRFNIFVNVVRVRGNPPEFQIMSRIMSIVCNLSPDDSTHLSANQHSLGLSLSKAKCEDAMDADNGSATSNTTRNHWFEADFHKLSRRAGFVQGTAMLPKFGTLLYQIHSLTNTDDDQLGTHSQRRKRSAAVVSADVWRYPESTRSTFRDNNHNVVVMEHNQQNPNHNWKVYSQDELSSEDTRHTAKSISTTNADHQLGSNWQNEVRSHLTEDTYPKGLWIAMIVVQVIAFVCFCGFIAYLLGSK